MMATVSRVNMERRSPSDKTIKTRLPTRSVAIISKDSVPPLRTVRSSPLKEPKRRLPTPKQKVLPARPSESVTRLSWQRSSPELSRECQPSISRLDCSRPSSKESAYTAGSTSDLGESNIRRIRKLPSSRALSPSSSSDGYSSTKVSPERQRSNTSVSGVISSKSSETSPPAESPTSAKDNVSYGTWTSSNDFCNLTSLVHELNERLTRCNGSHAGKMESEIQQLRGMLKKCRHHEHNISDCESLSSLSCECCIQGEDDLNNRVKTSLDVIESLKPSRQDDKSTEYKLHKINTSDGDRIASELFRLRLEVQRSMLDNQEKNVIITTLSSELGEVRECFKEQSRSYEFEHNRFLQEIEDLKYTINYCNSGRTSSTYKDASVGTDLPMEVFVSGGFVDEFRNVMGRKDKELLEMKKQLNRVREDNQAEIDETERVVKEGMESRITLLIKALDQTLEKNLELENRLAIFERHNGTLSTKLDRISEKDEDTGVHSVNKVSIACPIYSNDESALRTTRHLVGKNSNQTWRWIPEFRRRK